MLVKALNNVIKGASSLVIRGQSVALPPVEVKSSSVNDALRKDWLKIGRDMSVTMTGFDKNNR